MFENLTIEKTTTTERVAAALRTEMLLGRLAPGTPISEVSVSQSLGISRNTLREAVQGLEREGLLTWQGKSRVVSVPSQADVRDIFQVRRLLELAGIEAASRATPLQLAPLTASLNALERSVASGQPEAIVEDHIAFHESIVALIGSPTLCATFRTVMGRLRLALYLTDRDRADLPEQTATHRRVHDLLLAGDTAECAAYVRNNLERAEDEILDSLRRTP